MNESEAAGMRLAIYARVSTEEQREGQTINSQIAELERCARDKGWIIAGTYKDDGWSGGVMARPDLDKLRDDARRGLFQAVLINDVDRLARDVSHLGVIKRDLERHGAKVIFRKLPADTSPTGNLMVNILGSFAEFERELIADRVRRGRRHAVEVKKQFMASRPPYGYRYIPVDRATGEAGYLEVEPHEARVVRRMFEWIDLEGLSARSVMMRLNRNGTPARQSARWGKSSVLRILHSETYTGIWHYNKFQGCEPVKPKAESKYRRRTKTSVRQRSREEWIPLTLPESLVLVPRDRWNRVQDRIKRNIAFSPRNEKHFYLLKGLLRCGGCGASYVGDPCHGVFYYRCLKRCKRYPSIREERLNTAVVEAVETVLLDPATVLREIEYLEQTAEAAAPSHRTAQADADKELRRIQAEEARLLEAYRTEIITPAQLGNELERLKTRRVAAQSQLADPRLNMVSVPRAEVRRSIKEYCTDAARRLRSLSDADLRELLRTVIQTIVFEGSQIRIRGHLSAPGDETAEAFPLGLEFVSAVRVDSRLPNGSDLD